MISPKKLKSSINTKSTASKTPTKPNYKPKSETESNIPILQFSSFTNNVYSLSKTKSSIINEINSDGNISISNDNNMNKITKDCINKYKDGCCIGRIEISKDISYIDEWAFSECTDLISVSIPSNIISIKNSAFRNCNKLNDVIFNKGLINIEESAFNKCSSLQQVNLVDSVMFIGKYYIYSI